MNDLDTLRPEVREAVGAVDRWMTNDPDWLAIRAELLRLARENDEWQTRCLQFQTERDHARQMHADRDEDVQHEWARAERAEAELAALTKKCTCSRRSVSSPTGCRVCNPQLEIADLESKLATSEAELVDLKVKYTRLNEVCENTVRCLCEQDDEADRNEAELAALKDKIADAPITQVTRMAAIGGGGYEWAGCRVPDAWNGKRVRLLVEE